MAEGIGYVSISWCTQFRNHSDILSERAAKQVNLILENHVPEHLPGHIKVQLSLITQKAEKRL
jgi:hypothetical protein